MAKITIEIDTGDIQGITALAQMFGSFGTRKTAKTSEALIDVSGGVSSTVTSPESTGVSVEKKKKEKLNGRWSLKYDKCQQCGTTERKHAAKGLCVNCYMAKQNAPDAAQQQGNVKDALEFTGHGVCQNPACPYDPSDYRGDKMVTVNGAVYCSDYCAQEAQK